MKPILTYIAFIAIVVGLGMFSGLVNPPGDWYATLEKPFFNPPAWLFGPVWTALYVMIGIAGARMWLKAPASAAMQVWFGQLVLNLLWSPAFFRLQSPALGLMVVLSMLMAVIAFIVLARRIDRAASYLFLPYAAWVGFAALLNLSILILN
ncbi:tryptophan-rich sensory protein [Ciceribacter sp. L1K23]|uniref:TspO/MBR family protein n=1 Tax=Ciceribacter sp. L1K23 TaxID=2820276 RepID=UPI001B814397|nr:TspO/MBR family protein [Ciceribacter sp. L1K23]MBR0557325.1 tryptophan-rich sensory protein [Ciceribacter sp. L1K23]